ncbi:MAG: hypothetical protein ABIE36_00490 [Candidatus Diapherotrites archaeon]
MVKDEYNPEADNLAVGHAKADYLIKRDGSIENVPKLIKKDKKDNALEEAVKILSNTNPKALVNFRGGKVFDGIFRKLKKAGYDVKDTSRMDGPQKWGYYLYLMKEFDLLNKKD